MNSDNIFKTGHLSNMSDPLTFDITQKINTWLLLICLSFVGIHVSLLLFALLTYSKVEEIRTLNLEASTCYKIRAAGIFLKFEPLHIYVPVKSKLQHPPWATPQAFEFLENFCSNSPLPRPKSCSNAPNCT